MARGIVRKPSFNKIVGAYRSGWKRFWMRLFTFGAYGSRGIGWLRDPKQAWYNFWYYRSSVSVYRLLGGKPSRGSRLCAMPVALIASIFAAPVDATRAAVRVHRIKQARKKRSAKSAKPTAPSRAASRAKSRKGSLTPASERASGAPSVSGTCHAKQPPSAAPEVPSIPDERVPRSVPKHEGDRYVRKRMIICGSSYCDAASPLRLTVGTYFDLAQEPDNPYDRDAVVLTLNGEKIGYIAKAERLAFATSLRLGRKMYGVITDVKTDEHPTKYEFEVWFDSGK